MIKGHLVELVGQDPRVNQTLIMKRQRKCPLWTVTTNIVHWKSPAGKYTKDWTTHVKWGIPPSQKFIKFKLFVCQIFSYCESTLKYDKPSRYEYLYIKIITLCDVMIRKNPRLSTFSYQYYYILDLRCCMSTESCKTTYCLAESSNYRHVTAHTVYRIYTASEQ